MKNNRIITIFIYLTSIIAILFLYITSIRELIPDTVAHLKNNDQNQVIHDLNDNIELSQVFMSPYDFDYLTMSFSDHDEIIAGDSIFSVIDLESGDIIIQEVVENSSIHYGTPVKISFRNIGGGRGEKEYKVVLGQRNTEQIGLGVYGYPVEKNSEPAILNGEKQNYSLSIGTYSYTNIFYYLVCIVIILSSVLLLVLLQMIIWNKYEEEKIFLVVALFCGLMMFSFLSLNSTNDGGYHYENSYFHANKILGISSPSENQIYMREDDAAVYTNRKHLYIGHLDTDFQSEMFRSIVDFEWFSKTKEYVPVEYVKIQQSTIWDRPASVFALIVGRVFNLGTYPTAWLAKWLSFLVYVFIVYYAIKRAIIGKTTLVFIALLPRCLYSAMAITYDTMINSVPLLIFTLYLKLILKKLSKGEMAVLCIASFLLGAYKGGIYLPILLLGAGIFWTEKKKEIKFVVGTWFIALISMIVNYGNSIIEYLGYSALNEKVLVASVNLKWIPNSIQTAKYFDILYPIKEPWKYIRMLLKTIVTEIDNYVANIVQGDPHLNIVLPASLIFLFCLLLLCSTIREKNHTIKVFPAIKRISAGIVLLEVIGIMTVFLTTTLIEYNTIWGVNGRYFIPVLPLLLLSLQPRTIEINDIKFKDKLYFGYVGAEVLYFFFYFRNIYFT